MKLDLLRELAVARELLDQGRAGRGVGVEPFTRDALHLFQRGVTEHPQVGAVHENQLVARAGAVDRLGEVVRDGTEELLAFAEG